MVGMPRFELGVSWTQTKRNSQIILHSDKIYGYDYLILIPNDIVDKSLFLQFIESSHHKYLSSICFKQNSDKNYS